VSERERESESDIDIDIDRVSERSGHAFCSNRAPYNAKDLFIQVIHRFESHR